LSYADSVKIFKTKTRLEKRYANDGNDLAQVRTRGEFGDNSTVLAVNVKLGGDDAGQNFASIDYDGGRSFIT